MIPKDIFDVEVFGEVMPPGDVGTHIARVSDRVRLVGERVGTGIPPW